MPLTQPKPNTTIAITGASSGIGADISRTLAGKGYAVTLIARRADRLEELATELRTTYAGEVAVIPADLADPAARAELAANLEAGPTLVGLVNNAGFGLAGPLATADADKERMMVEVNVEAVHDLTLRLLPGMVQRGSGAILNTGSIAGAQPVPNMSTYAATKAFVIAFSEGLNAEVAGTGVSVTVLCPGPVKTEFATVAGSEGFEGNAPSIAFLPAEEVARQGVEAMIKGSRNVTPGFANRVTATAGRVAPRSLVMAVAGRMAGN